jgi:hypothetical protein
MSEVSNDESRLHATEAQMRRALGLQDTASPRSQGVSTPPPNGSHRGPRHFVRDGDVPVTIIHREETGTNQLDAARQTIRSLTATRERAERSLAEAQATIRNLQTKLMHERMSKDEAISRASSETQAAERTIESAQAELVAERAARRQTEAALVQAQEGHHQAEKRLRDMVATEHTDSPPQARRRGRPKKIFGRDEATSAAPDPGLDAVTDEVANKAFVAVLQSLAKRPKPSQRTDVQQAMQPRRRGRPPKVKELESESDFVEWWLPHWKQRLR